VTAASSNQALIPDANVVLGGSGANRTVMVTPASGLTGSATVTLTVSDGKLTTTESFVVTVQPVTPPNFTASNPPTAPFNGGQTAVTQTVSGFATFIPGQNGGQTAKYTVSDVSNKGLFLTDPAVSSDGTLTYTPKAGSFGSSTFSVTVSDGLNSSAPQTFTINVDAVNGLSQTTIPGSSPAIALDSPNWTTISTLVATPNSAGIPAGTYPASTRILVHTPGAGATVTRGDQVTVAYKGYLLDGKGTVFDSNTSAQFTADEMHLIPGFAAGLIGMKVGEERFIDIPSYLAYGANSGAAGTAGGPKIPANSRLVFDVTVNSIP
jgi:hypothetical protein